MIWALLGKRIDLKENQTDPSNLDSEGFFGVDEPFGVPKSCPKQLIEPVTGTSREVRPSSKSVMCTSQASKKSTRSMDSGNHTFKI